MVAMPNPTKTKAALLNPNKDYSHRFADVVHFLQTSGWKLRLKGSHRIFTHSSVPVLLNLQPEKDGKAKAYQIRQVRQTLAKFNS